MRMLGKAAFVDLGKAHLTDGGGRLQFVDFARPLGPAEPLHAFRDRAGAHQHDFLTLQRATRRSAQPSGRSQHDRGLGRRS